MAEPLKSILLSNSGPQLALAQVAVNIKELDRQIKQVAEKSLKAPSQAELDEAKALEKEIKVNQEIVKNPGRTYVFFKKDTSKEQALIKKLADKLIEILKRVFDCSASNKINRPMSPAEERILAKEAKRLADAYKSAGKPKEAAAATKGAKDAEIRAKAIEERQASRKNLENDVKDLQNWIKTPRHDSLRGCFNLWTTADVKIDIAQKKVRLAKETVDDVKTQPEKLKTALQELIQVKQELAKVLKADSAEQLATFREAREHTAEIQKIDKEQEEKAKKAAEKPRQPQIVNFFLEVATGG